MEAQPATDLRRKIAAVCLFAAPVLMLAGDLLWFGAGRAFAWLVLFKLAFAFFAGAALALVHLARRGADRTGLVGGALAIVGCLAGSGIVTASWMERAVAAGVSEDVQRAVEVAMRAGGVVEFVLLYPLPGLAFPLGFLVLSIAVYRAKAVSPPAAGLLALGAVLFPVGRIGGFAWAVIGSGLALTAGMWLVGLGVFRRTAAEWARVDAPRGEATAVESPTPAV